MRWNRISGPLKIGLAAALLGITLAVIGIARGTVPLNFQSILIALLISGVGWGLVAWAIATAAHDVESDLADAESTDETSVTKSV
jgi:hypothetical protein